MKIYIDNGINSQQRLVEVKPAKQAELLHEIASCKPLEKYMDTEKIGLQHILCESQQSSKKLLLSLWKPLVPMFLKKNQHANHNAATQSHQFFIDTNFANPVSAQQQSASSKLKNASSSSSQAPHLAVLCIHAGRFSGAIFTASGSVLVHKSFQKYVKRQKQGKSQLNYDKGVSSRHAPSSAGAQMRRLMAEMFIEELTSLLKDKWRTLLMKTPLITINAPGKSNKNMIMDLIFNTIAETPQNAELLSREVKIETIPFPVTSKPTFKTTQEVFQKLMTLHVINQEELITIKLTELKRKNKQVQPVSLTSVEEEVEASNSIVENQSGELEEEDTYLPSPLSAGTPIQVEQFLWMVESDNEEDNSNSQDVKNNKDDNENDDLEDEIEEEFIEEIAENEEEHKGGEEENKEVTKHVPFKKGSVKPTIEYRRTKKTSTTEASSASMWQNPKLLAIIVLFIIIPLIFIVMVFTLPGNEDLSYYDSQ